jgi:glycosyltransferase involved in cell wall biosynthesis
MLGHEVAVITNSQEVESEYKIEMSSEDIEFALNDSFDGRLSIVSTAIDPHHRYIPRGNPIISKLTTSALLQIEINKPDIIFSRYFEPYSIVGAMVSMYTGIGHVVAHAGSDVGRLLKSPALKTSYEMVLNQAKAVMTNRDELSIPSDKQIMGHTGWLPTEFFQPRTNTRSGTFRFGIYGKTGKHKGSFELIDAISRLAKEGIDCEVHAVWGGPTLPALVEASQRLGIGDKVRILNYMPHWKIPEFIASCDAMLFLENSFPIEQHTPQIPIESLSCGRPILLTNEIYNKDLFCDFRHLNCFLLIAEPFSVDTLVTGMRKMMDLGIKYRGHTMEWIDVRGREEASFWRVATQFERALQLCQLR